MRNVEAFGRDAYFEEDALYLEDFCKAILTLNNNFCIRFKKDKSYNRVFGASQEYHETFNKLVIMVTKLLKKLDPKKFEVIIKKIQRQNDNYKEVCDEKARIERELKAIISEEQRLAKEERRKLIAERLIYERDHPEEIEARKQEELERKKNVSLEGALKIEDSIKLGP